MMFRRLLFGAFFALFAATTFAQVQVDISMKRALYIAYEPVLVNVTITNLSGDELQLRDADHKKWFSFQVETLDGRPIPPVDGTYSNEPLVLGAGQKITRSVNLTPLFPISEFGSYRIRASVFLAQTNRFYSSPSLNIEVTDGRPIWQKTVGVPGLGTTRAISLIAHRLPNSNQLYIRIEDPEAGIVYCTHQLGRLLSFGAPNILLDQQNRAHVLQNSAPKVFIYSVIGLNGEVIERKTFNEITSRPSLRRGSDGSVLITGGQIYDPSAPVPEATLPSLSDRPVPFPTATPKPTPEDKRPENLLSR